MAVATAGGGAGGDRRRSRRGNLALSPSSISSNRPSARSAPSSRAGRLSRWRMWWLTRAAADGRRACNASFKVAPRRRRKMLGRSNGARISADRWSARSVDRRSDRRAAEQRAEGISRRDLTEWALCDQQFKVAYAPLWKAIGSIQTVKNMVLGCGAVYTVKNK